MQKEQMGKKKKNHWVSPMVAVTRVTCVVTLTAGVPR